MSRREVPVRLKFLGLLLFSGLLLAGPALADSITITGGFISTSPIQVVRAGARR